MIIKKECEYVIDYLVNQLDEYWTYKQPKNENIIMHYQYGIRVQEGACTLRTNLI